VSCALASACLRHCGFLIVHHYTVSDAAAVVCCGMQASRLLERPLTLPASRAAAVMDAYFDALEEEEEEQQQQQEQEQQRDKGERMIASRNSTAATPQSKDGPTPDSALLTKIHVPSQVRAGSGRDNSSAATNICALNAWHDHTIVV
jgi:hypothetical protein